jgi:hypothetical protein
LRVPARTASGEPASPRCIERSAAQGNPADFRSQDFGSTAKILRGTR